MHGARPSTRSFVLSKVSAASSCDSISATPSRSAVPSITSVQRETRSLPFLQLRGKQAQLTSASMPHAVQRQKRDPPALT